MILITGGTGFIGQALIRHLADAGYPMRILIRPSSVSPNLPRGVPIEVAVSSLNDERGLRASMVGVDTVYHLASGEWRGAYASLVDIDIRGTQNVIAMAADAKVQRIFYLSHLGADRASAYPVMKAKAISEEYIRRSGIPYTILRTAVVYGVNDGITTGLAQLLSTIPRIFLVPGDGQNLIQPLWVEDLATCLVWALDDELTSNQLIEIGGPEYLSFNQTILTVMGVLGLRKNLIHVQPPFMRAITVFLESLLPAAPVSVYWLDYLATNRTCALDSIPRTFKLMPVRFGQRLAYLKGQNWRQEAIRSIRRRRAV